MRAWVVEDDLGNPRGGLHVGLEGNGDHGHTTTAADGTFRCGGLVGERAYNAGSSARKESSSPRLRRFRGRS